MQKLHTLDLPPELQQAVNQALATVETAIGQFALSAVQRRRIVKMGPRSETFCGQTLGVMANHRDLIPASLDVDDAQRDLNAVLALRPIRARMQVLLERVADAEMALGSDAMDAALKGYGLLKIMGKAHGLTALHSKLGVRFRSNRSANDDVGDDETDDGDRTAA